MAILAGVFAIEDGAPIASIWGDLTRGLGAPIASLDEGPLRAAVLAQHDGEEARVPGSAAHAIGFGGDGATSVAELSPPWAACRFDPATKTARVEVDRHGFALVYHRALEGIVAFSSSAVALGRLDPPLPRDETAVAELFAFDQLVGERTWREGVVALPQGCALDLGPSGARVTRLFRYSDLPRNEASIDRTARELAPLWREGVAAALRRRPGDGVVALPLSGGLDSRMIAATAVELGARLDAFTFSEAGPLVPDVILAERVAKAIGAPWRRLVLEDDWLAAYADRAAELTDGQLDLLHSYGVSLHDAFPPGRLRLDGLAGDLVLGGSFLKRALLDAETPEARLDALWSARSKLRNPAWKGLLTPDAHADFERRAKASLAATLTPEAGGSPANDPRWSDFWGLAHRVRRFTVNGSLLWQGRAAAVFPFFAPRFFDRLMATSPEDRLGGGLQQAFFHHAFPAMAAIPWQKTGRPLPKPGRLATLRERFTKPQLAPGGVFFGWDGAFKRSRRMRDFVRETILAKDGIDRFGAFDRRAIEALLDDVTIGKRAGMTQLGLLVSLVRGDELWNQPSRR